MLNRLLPVGIIASTALLFTAGCVRPDAAKTQPLPSPLLRLAGATYAENIEIARQALSHVPKRPQGNEGAGGARAPITPIKFCLDPSGFPPGYYYRLELGARIVVWDAFDFMDRINPVRFTSTPTPRVIDTLESPATYTWTFSTNEQGLSATVNSDPLTVEFPFGPTPAIPDEGYIIMNRVVFRGSLTVIVDGGKAEFPYPIELFALHRAPNLRPTAPHWPFTALIHPSSGWTFVLKHQDSLEVPLIVVGEPDWDYPSRPHIDTDPVFRGLRAPPRDLFFDATHGLQFVFKAGSKAAVRGIHPVELIRMENDRQDHRRNNRVDIFVFNWGGGRVTTATRPATPPFVPPCEWGLDRGDVERGWRELRQQQTAASQPLALR